MGRPWPKPVIPLFPCSHKSLAEGVVKPDTYPIIDLILGKQRQPVITPVLQDTLRSYLAQGGNLLVSGTNLSPTAGATHKTVRSSRRY